MADISISARSKTEEMSDIPPGQAEEDDKGVAVPGAPADMNDTLDGCR